MSTRYLEHLVDEQIECSVITRKLSLTCEEAVNMGLNLNANKIAHLWNAAELLSHEEVKRIGDKSCISGDLFFTLWNQNERLYRVKIMCN